MVPRRLLIPIAAAAVFAVVYYAYPAGPFQQLIVVYQPAALNVTGLVYDVFRGGYMVADGSILLTPGVYIIDYRIAPMKHAGAAPRVYRWGNFYLYLVYNNTSYYTPPAGCGMGPYPYASEYDAFLGRVITFADVGRPRSTQLYFVLTRLSDGAQVEITSPAVAIGRVGNGTVVWELPRHMDMVVREAWAVCAR